MSQTKRTLASLSSDTHETAKHLQNSDLTKTTKFPKNCEGHNDENRYRTEFKDAHLNVFLSSNANFNNYTTIKVHKKDDQLVNDSMVMVDGILMKEEEAIKLKWERQMRKVRAADRASNTKVTKEDHLHILHLDEHFVAVNKPSGILCVPGIHCHDSLLTLVHKEIGSSLEKLEQMIVHRLDMDTSGVVLFARTMEAMSALHAIFRERKVSKIYEALVCGHIKQDVQSGTIDLPLQRDHAHPPFMRCATPQSEAEATNAVQLLQNAGYRKLMKRKPKPSTTEFHILSREYFPKVEESQQYPVTRIKLIPHTGRTHQLRVHCAALGHAIVADPTYGIYGEAAPNGGFISNLFYENRKMVEDINSKVQEKQQTMCLHAKSLEFRHPVSGKQMIIDANPPF